MASGSSILVTGGAGFIGSHLVDHLLAKGEAVTVVDDLSTGRRSNLEHALEAGDRFDFHEGTVTDVLPSLDPGRFTSIYHLAAAVGVRLVVEEPIRTIETNVDGTSEVLAFARRSRVPTLVASTSEVYGKGSGRPMSEDDDVIYGPTIVPRWSYACSKAIDEYLALAHHREGLVPTVVVRFFNTVGPRQAGDYGMVLPRFVEAGLDGADVLVHGDGGQSRCFCDVRDVVTALPRLLDDVDHHGRVFNLGNDRSLTIAELARMVVDRTGGRSTIRNIPYEEAFADDFEDLRFRQPDLSRIRTAIGFEPRISIETTIDDLARELGS